MPRDWEVSLSLQHHDLAMASVSQVGHMDMFSRRGNKESKIYNMIKTLRTNG